MTWEAGFVSGCGELPGRWWHLNDLNLGINSLNTWAQFSMNLASYKYRKSHCIEPFENANRECWVHMMTSSNGNIFPGYWPFVRGIHRPPMNAPHKGHWRGASMPSLFCAWANGWVNNPGAGNLGRHCVHYDVTVIIYLFEYSNSIWNLTSCSTSPLPYPQSISKAIM